MPEAKLYIVATPLGNLKDITLRAIDVLTQVDWIFAEDSRETMKLMELSGIKVAGKHVQSFAAHNMRESAEKAIQILREGKEVAMVSDRGTPAISDPGALLVRRAREEGFPVFPIPGASSVTALLSVTGWDTDRFLFVGFLPTTDGERREVYEQIAGTGLPACFFESPKRVRRTAEELKARFPHGKLFWGREMTKAFEEYREVRLRNLSIEELSEKGEYALVLLPGETPAVKEAWREEVELRLASDKDWAKGVAARHGVASKEVYNALQELKRRKL